MARRRPYFLFVMPVLMVLVLGLSVFIASRDEKMISARLLGGPTDSAQGFHGRVQVTRESFGVTLPLGHYSLQIIVQQGRHKTTRYVMSDSDGWAEFESPRFTSRKFSLRVLGERGEVLVEGSPQLSTSQWLNSARRRGGDDKKKPHSGDNLVGSIFIPGGVLAVPFESVVSILLKKAGQGVAGGKVRVVPDGMSLLGEGTSLTDKQGWASFTFRPQQHVVSLHVFAQYEQEKIEFDRVLPLVAGSFSLKREESQWKILSPVPRESLWFSFVGEGGRGRGGRLKLQPNNEGGAWGLLAKDLRPREGEDYLVLSSDADGRSFSTVGIPLREQGKTLDIWDASLLDGAPRARALENAKNRRIRYTLGAYAAGSGFLTLFLFWSRVKGEEAELRAALNRVRASKETQDRSSLPLLIACLSLFFAFSLAVLWIVAR